VQRLVNVAIAIACLYEERDRAIELERQDTGRSGASFIAMGIKATLLELELRRAVAPFRQAKNDGANGKCME
jgi:hypothetical protein